MANERDLKSAGERIGVELATIGMHLDSASWAKWNAQRRAASRGRRANRAAANDVNRDYEEQHGQRSPNTPDGRRSATPPTPPRTAGLLPGEDDPADPTPRFSGSRTSAANAARRGWTNVNSSGQGEDPTHAQNPHDATITKHGYTYSHSTPIMNGYGNDVAYVAHTYKNGPHNISVNVSPGGQVKWHTSTSTASGTAHHGEDDAMLDRHLASKAKRYPELPRRSAMTDELGRPISEASARKTPLSPSGRRRGRSAAATGGHGTGAAPGSADARREVVDPATGQIRIGGKNTGTYIGS
jgi:hypothetical protein